MVELDDEREWLEELLGCHRAVGDFAVEPLQSGVILSQAFIADEAGTTLPISVESEPLQFVASEEESLSDSAESWILELCGRPGHQHIELVAEMGDRERRRQLDFQQVSQCRVTRLSTEATTVGLSSGELVGPLATPIRPATPSAVYGVSLLSLELAKFENFGAVARYEADHSRGQAVYAPEVPRQDSIIFDGTKDKDCYASFEDMDIAMLLCGSHKAHGPFFDHAVSRLMMWKRLFGVIVFKVGIAAEPTKRYHEPDFGYAKEGIWRFMDVVVSAPANFCRHLEIELISAFRAVPGCYNEKPGGEGVSKDRVHLCFVYLVVADAGHGHALHISCKRRRLVDQADGFSSR
jgi:hypothetical protein